MPDTPPPFGAWVKQRRRTLDITQRGLAERVGCSVESLRKVEGGRLRPSRQLAALLVAALAGPQDDRDGLLRRARAPQGADAAPAGSPAPAAALPQPLTRLIGRDEELRMICAALHERRARLLTLSGPPGVGKTHLALAAAQALRPAFADQVAWVPLAHLHDDAAVAAAVALALGLHDDGERPVLEQISRRLRAQPTLLLLDNCEHLPGLAATAARLLALAPQLTLMATSRTRLGVPGEEVLIFAPLALPALRRRADGAPTVELAALEASPAVQLLSERARAIRPAFCIDERSALSVAELCIALDGLPLALELAAARLHILSPQAMLARIGDRFALLGGAIRVEQEQRQSLRDTLDLSFRLLTPPQRQLFAQLSVFRGPTGLAAIEAICTDGPPVGAPQPALIDQLSALVDGSLVQVTAGADGERIFTQLATVRDYGHAQLVATGAWPQVVQRHIAYYVALAEAAAPQLIGPHQGAALADLERAYGNLHAALAYAAHSGDTVAGLRLATALWISWSRHGRRSEGRSWLATFLARVPADGVSDELRRLRLVAGTLLAGLTDLEGLPGEVALPIDEELSYWRGRGRTEELSWALHYAGLSARRSGDLGGARASHRELVALWRTTGDCWNLGMALFCLGATCAAQGATSDAAQALGESMAAFAAAGDTWSVGLAQSTLGAMWADAGAPDLARPPLLAAVASFRQAGDRWRWASALDALAGALRGCGEHEQAAGALAEAHALRYELERC